MSPAYFDYLNSSMCYTSTCIAHPYATAQQPQISNRPASIYPKSKEIHLKHH
ncbi:MAG TPA: hypothetical protein VFG10_05860 [Saprospiraceae bacterium]|nr:hypothetical protein [Saprospiraceae bacterium]